MEISPNNSLALFNEAYARHRAAGSDALVSARRASRDVAAAREALEHAA